MEKTSGIKTEETKVENFERDDERAGEEPKNQAFNLPAGPEGPAMKPFLSKKNRQDAQFIQKKQLNLWNEVDKEIRFFNCYLF